MGVIPVRAGGTARTATTTTVSSLAIVAPAAGHSVGNLVVVAHNFGVSGAPSVTDSKSNTWTTQNIGLSWSVLTTSLVSGDTITVTCNATDGTFTGSAVSYEFAGVTPTLPLDDAKTGSGTFQVSLTAGTLAPTVAGELLVAVFRCNSGSGTLAANGFTPGSGWNSMGALDSGGSVRGLASMFQIAGASGSYATPATVSFSRTYTATSDSFKAEVLSAGTWASWV